MNRDRHEEDSRAKFTLQEKGQGRTYRMTRLRLEIVRLPQLILYTLGQFNPQNSFEKLKATPSCPLNFKMTHITRREAISGECRRV
eukprot:1357790-Amorphochlora_amoeboformis.AAC.2